MASVDLQAAARLLSGSNAPPRALLLIHLRLLGAESLGWESATVRESLQEQLRTTVSQDAMNKLHGMRTLTVSSYPWGRYDIFCNVATALMGRTPFWLVGMAPPDLPTLLRCTRLMRTIHPKMAFSEEVQKTVAACLMEEGIAFVHSALPTQQEYLYRLGVPRELHQEFEMSVHKSESPKKSAVGLQVDRYKAIEQFLRTEAEEESRAMAALGGNK